MPVASTMKPFRAYSKTSIRDAKVKTLRVVVAFHRPAGNDQDGQERQMADQFLASVKESVKVIKHSGRVSLELLRHAYVGSNTLVVVGLVKCLDD